MFITAVIGLGLVFSSGCKGSRDTDEEPASPKSAANPAAQISFSNGEATLTLDQQTQKRMGVEVATLTTTVTRAQAAVPAVVLAVQDLAAFRNGYVAAMLQIEKDRVDIEVAQKEYARLKTLFDNNQNASEKALQSVEGGLRSLQADERSAEQQLNLQGAIAEQQWGNVVAKWALDGSPELDRVLGMREILLQVTLPLGTTYEALPTISVEIPGRTHTEAALISPFPRVDPRIQGRSFLYATSPQPAFTPGVNLLAHVAVGKTMRGVTLPASAVVWSEGKAWAYVQTAANQFSRRDLSTDVPVENGYFLSSGFSAGTKVVSRGAQSLLSEESVLQGYGGGKTDEN